MKYSQALLRPIPKTTTERYGQYFPLMKTPVHTVLHTFDPDVSVKPYSEILSVLKVDFFTVFTTHFDIKNGNEVLEKSANSKKLRCIPDRQVSYSTIQKNNLE